VERERPRHAPAAIERNLDLSALKALRFPARRQWDRGVRPAGYSQGAGDDECKEKPTAHEGRPGYQRRCRLLLPGIRYGTGAFVFDKVQIIGSGRVGSALSARLRERGIAVGEGADLVVLCVPDGAVSEVARGIEPGPWIAHVSGATPLQALDPHERRFSVHPLQTFTRARGAEQFDGAWAAVTAEGEEGREAGFWLARTLGLQPFELADEARPLYHAGAAIASNYLVTLHEVATELFRAAGAPPEALVPLMRRTIDNDFELTGPIERGDWETVESHRRAIRAAKPELEPLYDVLAEATAK
jgi:predicted short-subunit dehydrogenase-like oxidoreductase (DUF2520 family)